MKSNDDVNKKRVNSKKKGSSFEREMSKILSKWIYNDELVLYRHASSGTRKVNFVGDIVPNRLHLDKFELFIETKTGYEMPSLSNIGIIERWVEKALNQLTDEQYILFLIVRFKHNRNIFLITLFEAPSLWIKYYSKKLGRYIYFYKLKEIIETQPYDTWISYGRKKSSS